MSEEENENMEDFQFVSKELRPGTWFIGGDGCSSWVLLGDDTALMIDTGYGVYDVRSYAETITGRRIPWAANTHGHFDHTGGNGFFERAYLSAEGDTIARIPYPSFQGQTFKFDYPSVIIGDGYCWDLGNRPLEAIAIPAHDPGSLAYLDKRERVLFVGDEIGPNVPLIWQKPDAQPSIEQYVANMEKLMARRGEYDHIGAGHGEDLMDASYVEKCLACARKILGGFDGKPMPQRPPITWEEWNKTKKGARPGDLIIYDPEFKYVAEYDGVTIMYDIRHKRADAK
jgi:glyoxylase-like metal-dependent hydrolase (beta-lactamase superfamily II)